MDTDRAAELNRRAWDAFRRQRASGLVGGRGDVVTPLARGHSYLGDAVSELAGDVRGQRLLDLGCGDGAELLEWACLGAAVVGVDNSPVQLAAARRAAAALGVPEERCRLVLADVLRLPEDLLRGEFGLVFSNAVLTWIGDLGRWFGAVRDALRPGGALLLAGGHPLALFYRDREQGGTPGWASYFDEGPFVERRDASHRWNPAGEDITAAEWMHTLGHIVTAVAQAGLRVTHLVELPDGAADYGVEGGPAAPWCARSMSTRGASSIAVVRQREEDVRRAAGGEARRREWEQKPPEERIAGRLLFWIETRRRKGAAPTAAEVAAKRAELLAQLDASG